MNLTNFKNIQEELEKASLSTKAKKSYEAKRWKEDNDDNYRTEFQRDIGRIMFSDPFRRLRMKAQVFMAKGTNQHNRTRLTHSLEVSQISKSISRPLGLNVDLTEAIALGHDLGHTPYGHAGENALNECLGQGSFSHNAQSVWIVRTTLAGRKDKYGEDYIGYNLTHDVVEGIWKHTKFEDTIDEFDALKYYNPNQLSSLEGQIVNLSDGIAYIKHDIDDAVRERIITYEQVEELWNKHFDFDFDKVSWMHHFIYDLIQNNQSSDQISFSEPFQKAFKEIKDFILHNVILSDKVKQFDSQSKAKVSTIFNYCIEHPDYLIKKFGEGNKYKIDRFGIERAAVDFIQWCGDELADRIYEDIK